MLRRLLPAISLLALSCSSTDGTSPPGADAGAQLDTGPAAVPDAGMDPPDSGPVACTDLTVFLDVDMDSFGVGTDTMDVCLRPGEEHPGYSRQAGDCRPDDPWSNPTAPEICGDNVDDNCDASDSACPTTQTAAIDVPSWDCVTGAPPANVYAYALFADGGTYFQANGCFVFFEGLRDEFFVQRVNLNRANQDPSCAQINGCVCPSLQNWPSYDRRMYAWTLAGTPASCAEIRVIDHGGEMQPVSNDCRKYLYQLHYYDIPYSYVAGGTEAIDRRITLFPTVEIACASEQYPQLPYVTLLTAEIQRNAGFVKKQ